jgi:hypothetical protein
VTVGKWVICMSVYVGTETVGRMKGEKWIDALVIGRPVTYDTEQEAEAAFVAIDEKFRGGFDQGLLIPRVKLATFLMGEEGFDRAGCGRIFIPK